MRYQTIALALPAVAQAQDSFFGQYKAKFQNVIGQFTAMIPSPSAVPEIIEEVVPEVLLNKKVLEPLALPSWKDTLYEPVEEDAKIPEQWWVFITGGNKTCQGLCGHAESTFNETAAKFASMPSAPHTAILNCEYEPILCNAWACSPGFIWAFDMLPAPANTTIHTHRLNITTVSVEGLLELQAQGIPKVTPGSKDSENTSDSESESESEPRDVSKPQWSVVEGFFHPLDGPLVQYNLQLPFAYAMWAINLVPQWAIMMVVSFATRLFMNRRLGNRNQANSTASAGAAVAAPAPTAQ
ncbi:hypothetical protein CFIMG_001548RA [Ceratocystis fimbriata CBS 114723]|uniref:Peptidyl-tRNA hydrolase n=1 Tax=Ceratocystis fimbriata CBS 114723 TaxID=1035309 RepID=A0A2C5X588_9PEZI|nr:hypothetical protein CFIMG_001548RA [Ceratocystis fimbriata CBS 114723]